MRDDQVQTQHKKEMQTKLKWKEGRLLAKSSLVLNYKTGPVNSSKKKELKINNG